MAKIRKWTDDEVIRLHELRKEDKSLSEIAIILGRSRKAIEHKIYGKPIPQTTNKGKQLSESEMAWLIKHYKHTKNDAIMARLGISHSSLHRIAHELGLTKSRQFMQKTQAEAAQAAFDSHKRNGTFPPKGYRIPNRETNCFKKGQSNRDRLSPKKYRECQEKRRASWRKTYDSDKRRTLAWGFEQRTKFRFVRQSPSKIAYRFGLRKLGYIEDAVDHNLFYYTSENLRRPKKEANAHKYGIRFLPYASQVKTS